MLRPQYLCALVCCCLASPLLAQAPVAQQVLDGYTPQASAAEVALEARFRDLPATGSQRSNMQHLSAHPHNVGSPYDKENADWLLGKFKEWGFDAHIETFYVLFPTPKERQLEMLEPKKFTASLAEPPIAVDPTSNQQAEQLPPYNAYSGDGDVTGPLVYVNYGTREDYDELERMGVSVKGAIAIARYGKSWRGIKPKVAAEHGAIGCIIYSDPQQDGYGDADPFPAGGGRPKESVQRGGVNDTAFPGDPLTPGTPRNQGCQAPCDKRFAHHHENSCAADFLCRRAAVAGSHGRGSGPRAMARWTAHHVPRGTRAGQSSPQDVFQLGYQTRVRRDRHHPRQRG